jgi:hypothetical protein
LRTQLGGDAQRIGEALGGTFVAGSKVRTHMAVVEDRMVVMAGLVDLIQRLRHQERAHAVTRMATVRAVRGAVFPAAGGGRASIASR